VHQDARYVRNRELHIKVNYSCIKMHATDEIMNYGIKVNHSCNKLHATHEIVNYA